MNKIKEGTKVTWTSQSNGSYVTKIGTVVEVVPVGKDPELQIPGCGCARNHESYVVDVKRGKTSRLYWPIASKLYVVKE